MTKSSLVRQELYTSALQYFEFYRIDTFWSLIVLTFSYVDLNIISASPARGKRLVCKYVSYARLVTLEKTKLFLLLVIVVVVGQSYKINLVLNKTTFV